MKPDRAGQVAGVAGRGRGMAATWSPRAIRRCFSTVATGSSASWEVRRLRGCRCDRHFRTIVDIISRSDPYGFARVRFAQQLAVTGGRDREPGPAEAVRSPGRPVSSTGFRTAGNYRQPARGRVRHGRIRPRQARDRPDIDQLHRSPSLHNHLRDGYGFRPDGSRITYGADCCPNPAWSSWHPAPPSRTDRRVPLPVPRRTGSAGI